MENEGVGGEVEGGMARVWTGVHNLDGGYARTRKSRARSHNN